MAANWQLKISSHTGSATAGSAIVGELVLVADAEALDLLPEVASSSRSPVGSRRKLHPGSTTVAECCSITRAGPWITSPSVNRLR
jgi:hypothetical protein